MLLFLHRFLHKFYIFKNIPTQVKMVAKFFEGAKVRADAKTTAYAAYAPLDRHIHVTSSNKKISVGEYCVFHVKTNKVMS